MFKGIMPVGSNHFAPATDEFVLSNFSYCALECVCAQTSSTSTENVPRTLLLEQANLVSLADLCCAILT